MRADAASHRRLLRRLLVAALPLLLLVACAGEEPAAEPEPAPEGAATETAAEPTQPTTGPEETGTDGAAEGATGEDSPLAGETIEFVVPYDPGGGYDTYVRLIAPHLEECTGGPVIVVNEPGAGGLAATTQTAVADPEGPRIQIINTVGAVSAQIAEVEGARFDMREFSWLGRVVAEPNVLLVAPDSSFQAFDDFLQAQEPVRFVSSGVGANDHVNAAILHQVYDFPAEIITGFAGAPEGRAAMLAGDADAQIAPAGSAAQLIQSGEVRPVLVIGESDDEMLEGVPRARDVPTATEDGQAVLNGLLDLIETGRSVTAPPGVPEDRLAALRDAFECAMTSEGLQSDAEAQQRPLNYLGGEETGDLVQAVLDAPPVFQEALREAS